MTTKNFDIGMRTFQFALDALLVCRKIKEENKEYIITNQLSRSATSVGANVREAKNAESKADFIHKLSISQKECDESIYWIELLTAFLKQENQELKHLLQEANELLRIIRTIILNTKKQLQKSS